MTTRHGLTLLFASTLAFGFGCEQRSNTPSNTGSSQSPGYQTDTANSNRTATDQSESAMHVKISADIRREILDDRTLSTSAQNCTVVTDNTGRVTLRGVVESQAEKEAIEAKARRVAGVTNVDNLLEVRPS